MYVFPSTISVIRSSTFSSSPAEASLSSKALASDGAEVGSVVVVASITLGPGNGVGGWSFNGFSSGVMSTVCSVCISGSIGIGSICFVGVICEHPVNRIVSKSNVKVFFIRIGKRIKEKG